MRALCSTRYFAAVQSPASRQWLMSTSCWKLCEANPSRQSSSTKPKERCESKSPTAVAALYAVSFLGKPIIYENSK